MKRFQKKTPIRDIEKLFLSTAFFLLVSGCLLGPDYEQPVFFEDNRIERALSLQPKQPLLKPQSLLDFQDETLKSLIQEALRKSPTIRTSLIRLRQSRETLRIQKSYLFPSFDSAFEYNYSNESRHMNFDRIVREDYYQAGLDMSWEIDIFGGTRRQIEAAQAQERADIESLKNVSVSLIAEVAQTYIDIRKNEELIRQARQNLNVQENLYQLTKDKYQTGLTDQMTLDQSAYLVETTKASIPQLEQELIASQNALALLLGKLPGELNEQLARQKRNCLQRRFSYPLDQLYGLPMDVLKNRPDVRVAEENLIAQNALVGSAVADLFPKISLSGLLGFESIQFPQLFNHKSYTYGYTPEITVPIFHFGELMARVDLQKLLKEEQVIAYEQTLLTAAAEIKNAMVSLEKEKKRNQSLAQAYRRISDAAAGTRNKYQNGLIDYSEVLNAEQRRLTAQTSLTESNALLYQNLIRFYKAIGGDMESKEVSPTTDSPVISADSKTIPH